MQFLLATLRSWHKETRESTREIAHSQPEATMMDACTARALLPNPQWSVSNVWGGYQAPRWCQQCQWGRKETPFHSLHQSLHQLHCTCVTTYMLPYVSTINAHLKPVQLCLNITRSILGQEKNNTMIPKDWKICAKHSGCSHVLGITLDRMCNLHVLMCYQVITVNISHIT